jgi:hypothetical protein
VQDDPPHRNDDFGAELEQPLAQRAHLRAGVVDEYRWSVQTLRAPSIRP